MRGYSRRACQWAATALMGALAPGFAQSYRIDAFAGSVPNSDGAQASDALLRWPTFVLSDQRGGYYISDTDNRRIRYVTSAGVISTVIGTGKSSPFFSGIRAADSPVGQPSGLALDGDGQLYFADSASNRIGRIDRNGTVTVIAGTGIRGFSGDGGRAVAANLAEPFGLAMGPGNQLFIADSDNNRIRKVDLSTGIITTIAGNGQSMFATGEGTRAIATPVDNPIHLAADAAGNVYYSEESARRVRRITPDGIAITIAGSGAGGNGGDGGFALQAQMVIPTGLGIDSRKNRLYIADWGANRVRAVDLLTGKIANFAGRTTTTSETMILRGFGGDGGAATDAFLGWPSGLSVDTSGAVLIADVFNGRIRRVDDSGIMRTVAGRWPFVRNGGTAIPAEFGTIKDVATDNGGSLYIADVAMLAVRKITSGVITTIAGSPLDQIINPSVYGFTSGDGGNALAARFSSLDGLAVDSYNRIYIADGQYLRRVDAAGVISTIAILPDSASCLAIDRVRNYLFVAIADAAEIFRMDLNAPALTLVRYAGTHSVNGFAGDGGPALMAQFNGIRAMLVDGQGNLLVADSGNNRVRRIGFTNGVVQTIAGNGDTSRPFSLVAATATTVRIQGPYGMALDSAGNLVIAEGRLDNVRLIDSSGTFRWIAGIGQGPGSGGDGGEALAAPLYGPNLVAAGPNGVLYLMTYEPRIRMLTPVTASSLQGISGNGQTGMGTTSIANPLTVRAMSGTIPVANVNVTFAVTSGKATVTPATVLTDALGEASARVTLGPEIGPVVVTATAAGLSPVRFTLEVTSLFNPNRPTIRPGGVVTAGAYGGAERIAPGSWIEIFGANLAASTRMWSGSDFTGDRAPTSLDGTTVTINDVPAFVQYVSPGQLNVQAPDGMGLGLVRVVVKNANGASDPYTVVALPRLGGLLAPAPFLVGGTQYVAAFLSDGVFAGRPDLIAGAAFRPARPGETVVLYGVGFGATFPKVEAGTVTRGRSDLYGVEVRIGGAAARVEYAGLAAGNIGLYQFNVVIPDLPPGDAVLAMQASGSVVGQRLSITIGPK